MTHRFTLDIEIHDKEGTWSQGTFLVHGWDDVLWTDSIEGALNFLRLDLEKAQEEVK